MCEMWIETAYASNNLNAVFGYNMKPNATRLTSL